MSFQRSPVMLTERITYAVVDEGDGPPVLLLHGFPDTSSLWRHQIPALVDAGYRAIAPDLRGFGESSKPQAVEDYKLLQIVGDLSLLLRRLGVDRAHIVGHDWGAAVAWVFASLFPGRTDHLVALSVGHPLSYHSPSIEQRRASWYMLLYQFEGVAERLLSRRDWELFREAVGNKDDIEDYIANLSRPGALTAALNWYRANRAPASELDPPPRLPLIAAPTLGVWGAADDAMLEDGMEASAGFVLGTWKYQRIERAGHWIPLDAPGELNAVLLEFLSTVPSEAVPGRTRRRF